MPKEAILAESGEGTMNKLRKIAVVGPRAIYRPTVGGGWSRSKKTNQKDKSKRQIKKDKANKDESKRRINKTSQKDESTKTNQNMNTKANQG